MHTSVPKAPPLVSSHASDEDARRQHQALVTRSLVTRWAEQSTLVLPAIGIVSGAVLALRGNRKLGFGIVGASIGMALARWQLARLVTECADYTVLERIGPVEIRRYAPQMRAETVLEGVTWKTSLNEGFTRLARYIFGENEGDERIAMTAPVYSTLGVLDGGETRTMAFVLPAAREEDTLPRPFDERITLRHVPEHEVATLEFRGDYRSALPAKKAAELIRRVRRAGLIPRGDVMFAGYDAPWTLPILRRNEVSVAIEDRGWDGNGTPPESVH